MLLLGVAACAPRPATAPSPTALPPTLAPAPSTPTAAPTSVPSATPISCETKPGQLQQGSVPDTKPAQEYIIYLPPCYNEHLDQRYPILYLLHGQTYTDQQWVTLGAPAAADGLIQSGQAPPFIMVFPDDRYWNLPPGDGFGDRLVHQIIPYIDQTYRTLTDRDHRALGGLSRGGGWSIHILLTRYDLFGTVGLHSPVILNDDLAVLQRLVAAVPANAWPRLWLDAGDHDGALGAIRMFEALLTHYEAPHEWHLYSGDHTDPYWHAHVTQYLEWYAEGFGASDVPAVDPTATP
jgi:enterochelin esterase-like enzyme